MTARFREKREAVLAAAAAQFNEQGVRGATLAGIAASVGLATNSVTYYYRKKEDLACACFLRAIEGLEAIVAEAALGIDARERVQRLFALKAERLARSRRGEVPPLMIFNDVRALPESHAGQVFEAYTRMFRQVRGLLAGTASTGWSRPELNARAHLLLSALHWLRHWIADHELEAYPRLAERTAGALLDGLVPAGAASQWPPAVALGDWVPPATADEGAMAEAFLRAATGLVNEQGFRGASVERISQRLNVTKGSFYHHHDNKHDLITACFERSFDVTRAALRAAEAAAGSGRERAAAAAQALVRHQLGEGGPLLRSTALSALPDAEHRAQVAHTMDALTARLAGMLVDGLADGSVRPQDPAIAAQGVMATINAAAELQRWVPGVQADTAADLFVRPVFEGLLCAPQGAR
jgi:AcrR family transcriptional regulator